MIDYAAALHSAKRLEDEYRESRQSVGLKNLEEIQKQVARSLLAAILESVRSDCKEAVLDSSWEECKESILFGVRTRCAEIGGFLSDSLLEASLISSTLSASTR